MAALRSLLLMHPRLAMMIVVVALCLKAAVPAGTMIAGGARTLTVMVCADSAHRLTTMTLVIPMQAPGAGEDGHKAAKGLCPFAALAAPALGGADPLLLAGAVAFVVAHGLAPAAALAPLTAKRLRPPLRGPPAQA